MKNTNWVLLIVGIGLTLNSVAGNYGIKLEKVNVDRQASEIKWTGYHLAKSYEHWGNVSIKNGSLETNGNEVISGSIVIDMKSITCGDIMDNEKNQKLIDDLKSEKFFNVKEYSTATLKINSTELSESGGSTAYADITIRGITKPINFEIILIEEDKNSMTYQAILKVNRIAHEVLYGWSIENVIISEEFQLEAKIVVNK